VHPDHVNLSAFYDDVGFLDIHSASTDGFDLPTFEDDASLVLFFDKIVVKGFFIDRNAHAAKRSFKIVILQETEITDAAWPLLKKPY
jgi:hypothetical protein